MLSWLDIKPLSLVELTQGKCVDVIEAIGSKNIDELLLQCAGTESWEKESNQLVAEGAASVAEDTEGGWR